MQPTGDAQKTLKTWVWFWMYAFTVATIVFLFFGRNLLTLINEQSAHFFPGLEAQSTDPGYWMPLVASLMVTLIYLCFMIQKDVVKYRLLLIPILISKFTSSLFFFLFFLFIHRTAANFLGTIVDGGIFLMLYVLHRRAGEVT